MSNQVAVTPQNDTLNQAGIRPPITQSTGYLITLGLTSLGVVYGDIGTSPLYAMRECFHGQHAIAPTHFNVLGVLSLIFWSLIIVISVKYLVFVMRADNRGEGGILALMSLIGFRGSSEHPERRALILIGLFGAALLYGDGMITPAISVLSAVEGLRVATPVFNNYIIPITLLILVGLFVIQQRGTTGVGKVFGPITLAWFITIAILGIMHIVKEPRVLEALNPYYCFEFFLRNQQIGFFVLGSVFLVITGGEALYADMGHFGRKPIRMTWFAVVLPGLLLNYFGQGALLLHDPQAIENPFYRLAPVWALYPLVVLAACATTIASQAVISGAFSLTRQAVQLGYCPRLLIKHTSAREIGQIYIPWVNWALMVCTLCLVLGFESSSNLAGAYGVAVTTTMVITTFLLYFVARDLWQWGPTLRAVAISLFLVIDTSFFCANIIKLPHGGWFPLAVAAVVFILMTTWKRGREILNLRLQESALPDELFMSSLETDPPVRVPGTAVFMDRTPNATPHALLHNIKHNKILHERVLLLTIMTETFPYVRRKDRATVLNLGKGIYRVILRYGFMDEVDVPKHLEQIKNLGFDLKVQSTSFFLGRERIIANDKPGMALWREKLFAWMSKNATGAPNFFNLPADRVVELGAQIEI